MKDELIDLVFNATAVWDKRNKQHHNRYVLNREWKRISEKLRVTGMFIILFFKNSIFRLTIRLLNILHKITNI